MTQSSKAQRPRARGGLHVRRLGGVGATPTATTTHTAHRQCMLLLLLLLGTLVAATSGASPRWETSAPQQYDVCVVGGGISGMFTAVQAKDAGKSVVVLERKPVLGGHCNTYTFTPPPGGDIYWVDYGVQEIFNTTRLNELHIGNWSFATAPFVERFASPMDITYGLATTYVDMMRGVVVDPPFNQTAFEIAFGTWLGLLAQYPFLTLAHYDRPIPPELLMPFDEYARAHALEPLADLIRIFGLDSGLALGNYSHLTALYMLAGMSQSSLATLLSPGAPVSFQIRGGCIQLYNGMAAYLGHDNIVLRATVTRIARPSHLSCCDDDDDDDDDDDSSACRIRIEATVSQPCDGGATNETYSCGRLVMAFPTQLHKLERFMPDLDAIERAVFDPVRVRHYYNGVVHAVGPAADGLAYTVQNADLSTLFQAPSVDGPTAFSRGIDYGPAQIQAVSYTELDDAEMGALVVEQLNNIPSTVIGNYTLLVPIKKHSAYQPHFTVHALAQDPSPYALLDALQGHRGTMWFSAENVLIASHAHIMQYIYSFLAENPDALG